MSHILCRFTNIFEKYKNILDDSQILVCSAKCVVHVSLIYLPKEMIHSCDCLLLTHPLKHQDTNSWSLGSVCHMCSTVPAFCSCYHWGNLSGTRMQGVFRGRAAEKKVLPPVRGDLWSRVPRERCGSRVSSWSSCYCCCSMGKTIGTNHGWWASTGNRMV